MNHHHYLNDFHDLHHGHRIMQSLCYYLCHDVLHHTEFCRWPLQNHCLQSCSSYQGGVQRMSFLLFLGVVPLSCHTFRLAAGGCAPHTVSHGKHCWFFFDMSQNEKTCATIAADRGTEGQGLWHEMLILHRHADGTQMRPQNFAKCSKRFNPVQPLNSHGTVPQAQPELPPFQRLCPSKSAACAKHDTLSATFLSLSNLSCILQHRLLWFVCSSAFYFHPVESGWLQPGQLGPLGSCHWVPCQDIPILGITLLGIPGKVQVLRMARWFMTLDPETNSRLETVFTLIVADPEPGYGADPEWSDGRINIYDATFF